jgi:hypothetical protein
MPTSWSFDLVSPRVPLLADLLALKTAVLGARATPSRVTFSSDDFTAFSPRLEGHWGPLHGTLPEFFAAVLAGSWDASLWQAVPTSLLGDFGEFMGVRAFQASLPRRSRVARVVRASGLKRPDFIVFDPSQSRLTAVECKAHSVNAVRLRAKTRPGARTSLNWCTACRGRRNDGLEQIGSKVVGIRRAPSGKLVVEVRDYRRGRVIAHATAIVTPFFPDGRLRPGLLFDAGAFTEPRICNMRCTECLLGTSAPLILAPVFHNAPEEVHPLSPVGEDSEAWFEAYLECAKALWTKSQSQFDESWTYLVTLWREHPMTAESGPATLQPLLDIVARAVEIGLDVALAIGALELPDEELEEALTLHSLETVPVTEAAEIDVDGKPGQPDERVDRELAKLPPPPRGAVERSTEERPPAVAAAQVPGEVDGVPLERWLTDLAVPNAGRRRRRGPLPPLTLGERALAWLEEEPDAEVTLRGALEPDGPPVSIWRAQRAGDAAVEVRVATRGQAQTRRAVALLMAMDEALPLDRGRAPSAERVAELERRTVESSVRLAQREEATSLSLTSSGARLERAWVDDEGFGVLTLRARSRG